MTSKVGLIPLPFSGGYYRSRSRSFSDKRLINWYVNYPDDAGINEYQLLPCAGITKIDGFFGLRTFRGAHVMNGKMYVVADDRLFVIDYILGEYTITELTAYPNYIGGQAVVIMASIKTQLVIVVPNVGGYIYTEGGSLVEITDPDFLLPTSVVAIDSYFVFTQAGTNVVFHSALNNGSSYSALDAYIVSQISICIGLIVYRNQLYVLGKNLIIPFSNQANAQFAFRPIPNAAIGYGVETNYLSINARDCFVFVGRSFNSSLSIWVYSSGSPQKISTPPIDYLLNQCTDEEISNAILIQYSEAGTECLTIQFRGYCFEYDFIASGKSGKPEWHERKNQITSGGLSEREWSVLSVVNCFGKNMVVSDMAIGYLDDSIGTEFGNTVRRVLNTQPYSMMGVNTKVSAIEIYTDVGVDDNSQLTISWSDDGGFTYGNKISRSTGAIGEYNTRVIWDQLGGFSRQRMMQLEYTGEYPRSINKIMANVQ